ncbi:hypothetical protein, partial [Streptomyces sp. NPDC059258]|uniref:hypothetical protein n=1 Tax=Streptomyces sp. NPDC059258 TaxID=3346795 RepID=UPI0036871D40
MPLISEEPQIPESAQGPRVTPAAGRTAPTPRPVPGPRSAATPRPGSPGPGPVRPAPPAQRAHPALAAPAAPSPAPAAPARPEPTENPSAPQIQLIPAPVAGALDAAEEAVDLLLESGRAPGDILVLTTGEQHPWAAHELSFGEASYWAQHDAGDDVFVAAPGRENRERRAPLVEREPEEVAARGLETSGDDEHRGDHTGKEDRRQYGEEVGLPSVLTGV